MTEVNISKQELEAPATELRDKRKSMYQFHIHHIFCTFILVYAVWTSYEISRLKYEFRELHSVCLNLQKSESESYRNGVQHEDIEESSAVQNSFALSAIENELDQAYHGGREKRGVTKNSTATTKKNKQRPRGKKKKNRRRRCKKCRAGKATLKPSAMKAVHYVAKMPTFEGICISKWKGTCCQNYTFWSNNEKQVMKFFQQKKWTSDVPVESPLQKLTNGEFKAVDTGLYLFYFNVGKHVKDPQEHIGLYVNEQRILHCIDSIDIVKPSNFSPFFNAKEKTCGLVGLHYVKAGEKISLKIISKGTAIILKEDETYFGAVLLR